MQVSFQLDKRIKKVGAVYVTFHEGKVAKTLELAPDEVFLDLDKAGNPVGLELLNVSDVGQLAIVCKKNPRPELGQARAAFKRVAEELVQVC